MKRALLTPECEDPTELFSLAARVALSFLKQLLLDQNSLRHALLQNRTAIDILLLAQGRGVAEWPRQGGPSSPDVAGGGNPHSLLCYCCCSENVLKVTSAVLFVQEKSGGSVDGRLTQGGDVALQGTRTSGSATEKDIDGSGRALLMNTQPHRCCSPQ